MKKDCVFKGVSIVNEEKLHPSVREFRDFINKHPRLIESVRRSGKHWQEYYEKWSLLGEDDPMWEKYKDKPKEEKKNETFNKTELFDQVIRFAEKMDMDKLNNQIEQLSSTIGMIQKMVGQFQDNKKSGPYSPGRPKDFNWFRD